MINYEKYTLDNGLTVIIHPDKSTPMVAIDVCYKVGSRDEDPERTGFAHLFEHLMFGGSKHIPNYDEPLQKAGGDNNAYTTNDLTNYYLTVPKVNMETGFWLESDRMLELAFSEKSLSVQKNVVIEEFKQRNLNQPYGDVWALVREMAYHVHPYRWATIGKEISHIENATLDHVKDFFYHHYAPNNAVLAVAGNVTSGEVMKLADKWFGPVPSREVASKNIPVEPPQSECREQTVFREVPGNALYMAFHMNDRLHPDYYVTDMISDILSNGNSSRLYQRLVQEKKIFSSLDAYVSGDFDPGLFIFSGNTSNGISLEQARGELEKEIELIKTVPVGEEELEKVKNKFEANLIYSEISYQAKAQNLAVLEVLDDVSMVNTQMDQYRAVKAADIQRVASQMLVPENGSVLYYRKKK